MSDKKPVINTEEAADLARLSFSKEELSLFEKDMETIVRFANKVSMADTENTTIEKKKRTALRKDIPSCTSKRKTLLSSAPKDSTRDGYFTVPRVVE